MKKLLLASVLMAFAALAARADLIWYEGFNYADGNLTNVSANVWTNFSGSGLKDMFVRNHKLEVSATGGTVTRADDDSRYFTGSSTNSSQVLYVSFTVNCTNLPNAAGTYFASFYNPVSGTSGGYWGRVWAQTNGTVVPGTWRLGVAGRAGTVSVVYPVDLALNTDYQVVLEWDPVSLYSVVIWVNPLNANEPSFASKDSVTPPAVPVNSFSFRQASSFGNAFFVISNLAAATTFEEAATNVWNPTPVAPAVVYQPQGTTNFPGTPANLSVVANGQSLASLNYQWRKDGLDVANPAGNAPVFGIAALSVTEQGNYTVVVSNPNSSLSVTSAVARVAVDTRLVAPLIFQQPVGATNYFGKTITLSIGAGGPGTLAYSWLYNNNPAIGANFSGADTPTLTVYNLQTNNGTAGSYKCVVSNEYGTTNSASVNVAAIGATFTNIAYLRGLVDPVFYLPTNTTAYWSVTGIVTTFASLTGGANASYVIQDGTAGIGVFVAGGAATLPQAGDSVTVTGPLGSFNGTLQFSLSATDPSQSVTTNSSGNLLPAGIVLPFSFTNGVAAGSVSNAVRKYVSSIVTFTNVYFPAADGTAAFAAGSTYIMTNNLGQTMRMFMNAAMTNLNGLTIPSFAWTVRGPMSLFLSSNTDTNRAAGFELLPTNPSDIVTDAPLSVTGVITLTGGKPLLTWLAQPFMSYSILRATNVNGAYLPLATGLTFNTTAGKYNDTNTTPATRFYRIISP